MTRVLAILVALVSPFLFPAPFVAFLALCAGFVSPVLALSSGILYDTLYYTGAGLPLGLIIGVFLTILAFFMRRFWNARIMA